MAAEQAAQTWGDVNPAEREHTNVAQKHINDALMMMNGLHSSVEGIMVLEPLVRAKHAIQKAIEAFCEGCD